MNIDQRIEKIKNWILNYCESMPKKATTLCIGVSGGIDSSVTSTICALTGMKTIALSMPIRQIKSQDDLSKAHCKWLKEKYKNVETKNINLDNVFDQFEKTLSDSNSEHAFANSRARLRMMVLYQISGSNNGLIIGTGNKIEDYIAGFATKHGDMACDLSPIGDCTKSQVWDMGKELNVDKRIINAKPTDGLFDDGRTDEDQLKISYQEIENIIKDPNHPGQKRLAEIKKFNLHKMVPIPVCKMDN